MRKRRITVEDICDLKEKRKIQLVMIVGKEPRALKVWSSILSAVTLRHQKSVGFCHFSILSWEVSKRISPHFVRFPDY